MALARVCRSTRGSHGKYTAKMAGSGSDVLMADAAGAAGGAANGPGDPAGRDGSSASVDSGPRQDESSADNGRDMRGGGILAYPDGAEDQAAELPLIEGAVPSAVLRTYLSRPSLRTRDGVPVMSDNALMDAATNNRRVALV